MGSENRGAWSWSALGIRTADLRAAERRARRLRRTDHERRASLLATGVPVLLAGGLSCLLFVVLGLCAAHRTSIASSDPAARTTLQTASGSVSSSPTRR